MTASGNGEVQPAWQPDAIDQLQAQEGYFRYATGLAILNDPEGLYDMHKKDVEQPDSRDQLLVHVKTLMWLGLSEVIRYANPPERSKMTDAEDYYEEAVPHMQAMLANTVSNLGERLDGLNSKLTIAQPLPVNQRPIYRYIAHARKTKVTLGQTMDVFTIDPVFGIDPAEETFVGVKQKVPAGTGRASRTSPDVR